MPYKTKEKKRQYQKEFMRKKRAKNRKTKEEKLEEHLRLHPLDLNFGLPKPKKPTLKEWLKDNPSGTFQDYVEFCREEKVEVLNQPIFEDKIQLPEKKHPYDRYCSCNRCSLIRIHGLNLV